MPIQIRVQNEADGNVGSAPCYGEGLLSAQSYRAPSPYPYGSWKLIICTFETGLFIRFVQYAHLFAAARIC